MKQWLLAIPLSFLALSCNRANLRQDIPENCKLLKQILTQPDTAGRYTVVNGWTYFEYHPMLDMSVKGKAVHFFMPTLQRSYIKSNLQIPAYNVGPLVDVLYDINRKGVPLEIESDSAAGYIIYKDKIWGTGWKQFCKGHPKIHGITTVSVPAYDKEAGIVLVYKGIWFADLAAEGDVIAYRLSEGKLIELKRVMLWVS